MEQVSGTVENVIFQSDDSGFSVFRLKAEGLGMVTAVYKGQAPFLGEPIEAQGMWVEHSRFGKQFSISAYKAVQPSSAAGIERFLASGAVKGIGRTMAARIVECFGATALDIMAKEPQRLAEVAGIGKKKAKDIGEAYADLADMRELMLFLEENGVSANYAPRLQAKYGATAIARIQANPYSLAEEIEGIGFKTADRIAIGMGFRADAPERLQAGLGYALGLAAQGGHTCIPEEELLSVTARLLQVDYLKLQELFTELVKKDLLRTVDFGGVRLVYPEYLFKAEVGTAKLLLKLRDMVGSLGRVNTELIIKAWEREEQITLAEAQKEAIRASLKYGIFALTGGPGTGKTTVIKGIISVLENAGCKVLLAAPTGRAARRLAEAAGRKAQTVHRLLEYNVTGEFGKNEGDPLEAQAVIIDEASMLDIVLTYHLLEAVKPGCRLIFVGDVDQLPSVGAGSVLKDIIRCGKMPVVRLMNVFRQAEVSPIVRNAHKINRGEMPECEAATDFAMSIFTNEFEAVGFITNVYAKACRVKHWQYAQVLSPMHKGPCGVQNLNKLLQERMNPAAKEKGEIKVPEGVLRQGDKVMQIRNNYEKDVYNGDIGKIVVVVGKTVKVWFPERPDGEYVTYEQGELDELRLAYAMSVHKSQGSEYPMVILALVPGHYIMLQRNLLYTAITRAKERVLLVGTKNALQTAVDNDKTKRRYSLLAERLQENGEVV